MSEWKYVKKQDHLKTRLHKTLRSHKGNRGCTVETSGRCHLWPHRASSSGLLYRRTPAAAALGSSHVCAKPMLPPWGCSQPMTKHRAGTRAGPFLGDTGLLQQAIWFKDFP